MRQTKRWASALLIAALLSACVQPGIQVWPPPGGGASIQAGEPNGIYVTGGGKMLVVPSGAEIQVNSGATFDSQSGATTDFSSGIDLDGALLDLDADGDTSITADTDDQIDIEVSGADDFRITANTFTALAGSSIVLPATADINAGGFVKVGNGTADGDVTAGTDEQLYVEGNVEIDGILNADGAINADSTADIAGAVTMGSTLEVTGLVTATLAVTAADLAATDDLTVGDDLTITGRGAVGEWWTFTEQTAISVTAGAIITPTGTNQPLTSATAVTTSLTTAIADGPVDGAMLILRNDNASDAIIVDNGANTFLSGNITLGTGDTLTLQWDATKSAWVQLATSDNS